MQLYLLQIRKNTVDLPVYRHIVHIQALKNSDKIVALTKH